MAHMSVCLRKGRTWQRCVNYRRYMSTEKRYKQI